jgi:cytochrome c oxidase cbb3-type subunit 3
MTPSTDNPFVVIMLVVIFILGIAISLLANVLLSAAQFKARESGAGDPDPAHGHPATAPGQTLTAASAPASGAASSGGSTSTPPTTLAGVGAALSLPAVNGISDTAFYLIVSVIALEVFVIMALLYNLRVMLGLQWRGRSETAAAAAKRTPRISWWTRLNRFKPIEQEADLDLGHDYDGIRELDNRLPPWWLYGFYCTIIFAVVYLWRYHVARTAPLPAEEYAIAVHEAEIRKAEYLKKAADNVDENTVRLSTAPDDLAAGKAVFEGTCFACHGKHGEGGVGPNLTDDYWLHGGSINDVFRTIKYGWPEKGMKSWKDDYSPRQIAQIASYVKSLGGTHPDNPKPPQGTLYKP